MGRNAQRRRTGGDPVRRLGELLQPLAVDAAPGHFVTVGWDPTNPTDRRRVRRIKRLADRIGYDVDLEESIGTHEDQQ